MASRQQFASEQTETMNHPLQQQVQAVGQRAKRVALLYGIGWFVCLALAAIFLVALSDYLIRFRDPGVRIICSLAVLLVVGWSFGRFVYPALQWRQSATSVAQQIERRYPQLEDRLSSAVEFLNQSEHDPLAGSVTLRRSVVAEAAGATERLDLLSCIDTTFPRRIIVAAVVTVCAVAGIGLLDVSSSLLAAKRMLLPWSDEHWPQQHQLQFVGLPERIASGSDFEVEIQDRNGKLPHVVDVEFRIDGGSTESKALNSSSGKVFARLNNVTRSFQLRASGGDDNSMPWYSIDVIEPARMDDVVITVVPPDYTRQPPRESGRHLRVLEGTRIQLRGTATGAIQEAVIRFQSDDQQASIPLAVNADGTSFQSDRPWIASRTGTYWIEVTDAEGLTTGSDQQYELRVGKDQPPTVSIESPTPNALVTAQARVPLKVLLKDDFAVATATLHFKTAQSDAETTRTLAARDAPPAGSAEQDVLDIDEIWSLAEMANLNPGDVIEFHVSATDFKPHEGESLPARLTIISESELQERLAQQQAFILARLIEALRVQEQARSQVTALEIQLREANALRREDQDTLQGAELNQRQVARLLVDENEGVEFQIKKLLDDVHQNQLDSPDVERRMNDILAVVRGLSRGPLPEVQQHLISALKTLRSAEGLELQADVLISVRSELSSAGSRQDEVILQLQRLVGQLSEWDTYRRFSREVSRILNDQNQVALDTGALRLKTLAKDIRELSAEERADLGRLAQRQLELSRQFDKTMQRMRQVREEIQTDDPLAANTLSDALETARQLGIGEQMREAMRTISDNRMGQALEEQQASVTGLQELLDVLSNRREHDLKRLQEKLKEAEAALQSLDDRVKRLRKKMDDLYQRSKESGLNAEQRRELERLTREQEQLAEQAEELTRQLQRLTARGASKSVGQAGSGAATRESGGAVAGGSQAATAEAAARDQAGFAQRTDGATANFDHRFRFPAKDHRAGYVAAGRHPDRVGWAFPAKPTGSRDCPSSGRRATGARRRDVATGRRTARRQSVPAGVTRHCLRKDTRAGSVDPIGDGGIGAASGTKRARATRTTSGSIGASGTATE